MLGCGKESAGYSEYRCVHFGGDLRCIGFSCKSGFCLSCSKKYVDDFVVQVSRVLHGRYELSAHCIDNTDATENHFL